MSGLDIVLLELVKFTSTVVFKTLPISAKNFVLVVEFVKLLLTVATMLAVCNGNIEEFLNGKVEQDTSKQVQTELVMED